MSLRSPHQLARLKPSRLGADGARLSGLRAPATPGRGLGVRAARVGVAAGLAAAVTLGAGPITTPDPASRGSGVALLPAAQAHAQLLSSQPADGASVERVPDTVTFTFNEEINPSFAQAVVVGVDGEPRTVDSAASGPVVTAQMPDGLAAGRIAVRYRVVSKDGHPIEGEISFTAATGAPGAPAATTSAVAGGAEAAQPAQGDMASSSDDPGFSIWAYPLVGIGALLLFGVGLALRARPKRDLPDR